MSGSMFVIFVRKFLRDKIICEYIFVLDNMNCINENIWKFFVSFFEVFFQYMEISLLKFEFS